MYLLETIPAVSLNGAKVRLFFLTCKIFRCFLFLFSNYFYNHLKISVCKYSFLVLYFWFLGCKTVKKAIFPLKRMFLGIVFLVLSKYVVPLPRKAGAFRTLGNWRDFLSIIFSPVFSLFLQKLTGIFRFR